MADLVLPASSEPARRGGVARAIEVGGRYAWRLVGIALVVIGLVWLTRQLLVVVVPVAIAVLLTLALAPVAGRLRRAGLKPALAAVLTLVGFLVVLAAVLGFAGWAIADEATELGPTLREGLEDIETWLIEDSPFDVSQADVDEWRAKAGDALS